MISRNDFHVIQGDRERSSVTDANTTRSTKPRVFFLARADDLTNGDDFFADSERRHVFLCFYKRFARALGYARTPITWTCSTSAGSCPSSRATCARPPRPCGAPCLAARAKREAVRVSGERKKKRDATGVCARTGATGDSAHRAYLLQRVIRGVEVFDILFARVRFQNAIAGGQRERSRGGKNARRVRGEVTTFDEPRDSGLGVFFVSAARSLARTLWMSFFFGFRSPYFALSFSSCCRMISSGEGWRGGGVEGVGSGSV